MVGEGLDLVVVNYRSPYDLEMFLGSYVDNPASVPCNLWVANVDPQDWDRSQAKHLAGLVPDACFVEFDTNVGYATAVNECLSQGSRSVAAAFNADTKILPGVLDGCYEKLMAHDDWGVIGPRQFDEFRRMTHAGIFGTNTHPVLNGWLQFDREEFQSIREDAVSVAGSAYFIRRSAFDELTACPIYRKVAPGAKGPFLPTQHYYEETACSYHARAHGWKVVYDGEDAMVHQWHRASPVGGWAEQQMPFSQEYFRVFCDAHEIDHD